MIDAEKVFRLFPAWNIERECEWLRNKAADGWYLTSYFFGFYEFRRGNPGSFSNEIDFQILRSREQQEYLDLYRDSGWELAASFANWYYFRAPADRAAEQPAYSDVSSRRAKYLRVVVVLLLAAVPAVFFGIINPLLNGYLWDSRISFFITGFASIVIVVFIYSAVRIGFKMRRRSD